ncbi:WD40 repeat domain-containing protein [Streptomyces scabiei]|uniref:WD40 repeat domain-containing protein n=1 Tax=Streptomyces scabiei TaxID=1930 RepID=UPI0038F7FFEE
MERGERPDGHGDGDDDVAAAPARADLAHDARFLASADPDRLARVLHRLDRSRPPLLRAYWRALDRLRAAAPADRAAVLQAMALCEEPEAFDGAGGPAALPGLGLAEEAGWDPLWAGGGGRTVFHRRLPGHGDDPTRDDTRLTVLAFGTVEGRAVLASGGRDGEIRLWDARTGEPFTTLATPLRAACTLVEFGTVDGRPVLAAGTRDGLVRIWDLRTAEPSAVFSVPAGHARAAAFATLDDGRRALAVAHGFAADDGSGRPGGRYADDAGGVDLWDPLTGDHLVALCTGDEVMSGVAVLTVAGRAAVAAVCGGDTVRVWDATGGEPVARWSGEPLRDGVPPLTGLLAAVAHRGREVLAVVAEEATGWDNREWRQTLFLWDPSKGSAGGRVERLDVRESESVLAFGRLEGGQGGEGAGGGDAGGGGAGDRADGEDRGGGETVVATVAPRSDGAWSDDVEVRVSTLAGRSVAALSAHLGHVLTGAFGTVDGTTVLATTRTGGFDRTPEDGHGIVLLDVPARSPDVGGFRAGGLALGTDGRAPLLLVGGPYEVRLTDPLTGRTTARASLPLCDDHRHGQSRGVAVAPAAVDGSPLIAVAGIGHGVVLCDPATGSAVRRLRRHPACWSRFVAYGDTGRRVLLPGRPAAEARRVDLLAEADTGGPVTVWDAATGDVLATLESFGRLTSLTFGTVAGRTVLATVHGESLRLWDPVKGKQLRQLPCGAAGSALGTVAGRDVHVSAAGRRIRVRDLATGRLVTPADNPGAAVTCLALATVDGRSLLATGDTSGAVRVWDAVTGDHLTVVATFARVVHDVLLAAIGGETYVFAQSRAGRVTAARLRRPSGPGAPDGPRDGPGGAGPGRF